MIQKNNPCKLCPFKRDSLPGYLGHDNADNFINTTLAEVHMPCHLTIDYEDENWQEDLSKASRCAGSLIFFKNQFKLPIDKKLTEAIDKVERSKEVFAFKYEFLEHHRK